jgi:predicted nuclease with TOPRIM domain
LNSDANPIGEAVLEKLETYEWKSRTRRGYPEDIMAEISKLREVLDRLPPGEIGALRNRWKSQELTTEEPASAPTVDLAEVHAKLDGLIESLKSQLAKEPAAPKIEIPEVWFAVSHCCD